MCMVERFNDTHPPNPTSLNCTSNDVSLASFRQASGPASCIPGNDILVKMLGEFVLTSNERWDISMFVGLDGDNPNGCGSDPEQSGCAEGLSPG